MKTTYNVNDLPETREEFLPILAAAGYTRNTRIRGGEVYSYTEDRSDLEGLIAIHPKLDVGIIATFNWDRGDLKGRYASYLTKGCTWDEIESCDDWISFDLIVEGVPRLMDAFRAGLTNHLEKTP